MVELIADFLNLTKYNLSFFKIIASKKLKKNILSISAFIKLV